MSSRTDINAEWNQNILRNLKAQYPELIKWIDETIIEQYNDYIMSENSAIDGEDYCTFLEWIEDIEEDS